MFPIRDHNPSGRTPYVTYILMAANIAIFLSYVGIMQDARALNSFWYDWAIIPARISDGEAYHTLVSSMFLHGGFLHLAGNMLFLWIFGDNVEDALGHWRYLGFYIAAGVAAALAQYVMDPGSMIPTVGASGAIAGVMGAYLLLFPKAKVDILLIFIIFFRIFPIPAWIMLAVWFAMQFARWYWHRPRERWRGLLGSCRWFRRGAAAGSSLLARQGRSGLLAAQRRATTAS